MTIRPTAHPGISALHLYEMCTVAAAAIQAQLAFLNKHKSTTRGHGLSSAFGGCRALGRRFPDRDAQLVINAEGPGRFLINSQGQAHFSAWYSRSRCDLAWSTRLCHANDLRNSDRRAFPDHCSTSSNCLLASNPGARPKALSNNGYGCPFRRLRINVAASPRPLRSNVMLTLHLDVMTTSRPYMLAPP